MNLPIDYILSKSIQGHLHVFTRSTYQAQTVYRQIQTHENNERVVQLVRPLQGLCVSAIEEVSDIGYRVKEVVYFGKSLLLLLLSLLFESNIKKFSFRGVGSPTGSQEIGVRESIRITRMRTKSEVVCLGHRPTL